MIPFSNYGRVKPSAFARVNWRHPFANRLIGAWVFTEGGGLQAFDARGRPASTLNAANWGLGPYGGPAVTFNGTSDKISVVHTSDWDTYRNKICMAACIKPSASNDGNYHSVVQRWDTGSNNALLVLFLNNVGKMAVYDDINGFAATGATVLNTSQWYYVVADQSSSIYLNGEKDGSGAGGGSSSHASDALDIGEGRSIQYFAGLIDHVYLFSANLSNLAGPLLVQDPFALLEPVPRKIYYVVPATSHARSFGIIV